MIRQVATLILGLFGLLLMVIVAGMILALPL
jgi:hypothetical protein